MAPVALAASTPEPEPIAFDRAPPRLGFAEGRVSFWRPGAQDWAQAQVNTPLAPGDQLSTGSPGNLEVQVGARAFVRAWANTQLGLGNRERLSLVRQGPIDDDACGSNFLVISSRFGDRVPASATTSGKGKEKPECLRPGHSAQSLSERRC